MHLQEFLLIVAWLIFGGIHSLTAHDSFKKYIHNIFSALYPHYRIAYNILALITLTGVLLIHYSINSSPIPLFGKNSTIAGGMLIFLGMFIIIKVLLRYDAKAFLGISKQKNTPTEFVTDGLSAVVRHPMYVGTVLVMVGFFLFEHQWKTFISVGTLFIYLQIGIYFEEKKLSAEFGTDYLQYKKTTPRLFLFNPIVFIKNLL